MECTLGLLLPSITLHKHIEALLMPFHKSPCHPPIAIAPLPCVTPRPCSGTWQAANLCQQPLQRGAALPESSTLLMNMWARLHCQKAAAAAMPRKRWREPAGAGPAVALKQLSVCYKVGEEAYNAKNDADMAEIRPHVVSLLA